MGIIRPLPKPRFTMKLIPSLKSELSWFAVGVACACLVGIIIGFPALSIIVFSIGYVLWIFHRLNALVSWLRNGGKPKHAPPTTGIVNDMVQLIHREKTYSRKQKNRYRSTLAQFNSLASDLPDATIVLDRDHEIRWSNSAALRLLNVHPERDSGQRIDNLVRMPGFRDFLLHENDEEELEMPSPAASDRILAIRKVPTGRHMTVLIATDATQRVQLREMRKAFVGDVSHELRTPLTVIRGYLEMLREIEHMEPEVDNCLKQIANQSDRMSGIVEDLLQLSKLEGNPLAEGEGENIQIEQRIQAMVSDLSKISAKHQFSLDLTPALGLRGSETEIYSALNNLIVNAVQYTAEGTHINVSWKPLDNGGASYCVTDNGPGIESRHLPRLSERFYRIEPSRGREQGGTGLGLAIVKHVAQRHGGQLSIDSTPGVGSSFEIVFPALRVIHFET